MSEQDTIQARARARPRTLEIGATEGTILVNRTRYGGEPELLYREQVRVPVFGTAPARVRVSGSATQPLGDGHYAKVEVSVELPALPEESELARAYALASRLVDDWTSREMYIASTPNVTPESVPLDIARRAAEATAQQ